MGFLEQPVLEDLLGPEAVAAMDQRHLRRMVREVERLLDRRVAAADHDHFAVAEKEAVAGRAGRNAAAPERLLRGKAEPPGRRSGRNDQCVRLIAIAGIADAHEGTPGEIDLDDGVEEQPGADMLGLGLHLLHQPWALDHVREAWVVLDIRRYGELPTGLDPLHQHGLEARTRCIDRRRIAGRTRSEDQNLTVMSCCHDLLASRLPHDADIYANLSPDARGFTGCEQLSSGISGFSQLYCAHGMVLA